MLHPAMRADNGTQIVAHAVLQKTGESDRSMSPGQQINGFGSHATYVALRSGHAPFRVRSVVHRASGRVASPLESANPQH